MTSNLRHALPLETFRDAVKRHPATGHNQFPLYLAILCCVGLAVLGDWLLPLSEFVWNLFGQELIVSHNSWLKSRNRFLPAIFAAVPVVLLLHRDQKCRERTRCPGCETDLLPYAEQVLSDHRCPICEQEILHEGDTHEEGSSTILPLSLPSQFVEAMRRERWLSPLRVPIRLCAVIVFGTFLMINLFGSFDWFMIFAPIKLGLILLIAIVFSADEKQKVLKCPHCKHNLVDDLDLVLYTQQCPKCKTTILVRPDAGLTSFAEVAKGETDG